MNAPDVQELQKFETELAGPVTVVLAESQVLLREALADHFGRAPQLKVVGEVGDGHRAVDLSLRLKPQVVLLAADMPGLNAIEVCRTISAAAVGVQVLVLTAHCGDMMVRQLVEAGALGIVETTASLSTLVQATETVGSGRAFFGERVTQVVREALRGLGARTNHGAISWREHEVLRLITGGFSNKEIATQLGICAKTVENHRCHLMRKLNAHNGAALTREAFRLGIVKPPSRALAS